MVRFDSSPDQEPIKEPLLRPTHQDVVECERLLEENETQFARRTFCRASFAFIETVVHWLKTLARNTVIAKGMEANSLNVSLISALLDQTARVERTGRIRLEPNMIPFLNHVALVFRTMAEVTGLGAEAFFSNTEWEHLRKALQVRHRITHPKNPEDLTVTDSDMDNIRGGLTWVFNRMVDIANREMEIEEEMKKGTHH